APPRAGDRVAVRRSGGFAGRTTAGAVDLTGDDARAGELRDLVGRIDVRRVGSSAPQPDRFVYAFELGDVQVTVPEQDLTSELRRVADLVLRDDL
ncbi:protealysin inhibitor emfourin, partial [Nocardioides dongxiaopingii]|uniref:protealysin inhibitor emfourin n=1 Tax=Nocardioides dongxiaopingii TaxID=2576036 RepID=UPI00319D90C3